MTGVRVSEAVAAAPEEPVTPGEGKRAGWLGGSGAALRLVAAAVASRGGCQRTFAARTESCQREGFTGSAAHGGGGLSGWGLVERVNPWVTLPLVPALQ